MGEQRGDRDKTGMDAILYLPGMNSATIAYRILTCLQGNNSVAVCVVLWW